MKGFNFKYPIQMRYSDFDMLGHLNSAQYVTLFELGRLKYFEHINWNLGDVSNVVASFKIDYLNQVIPYNEVEVHIKVTQLGTKSFAMEYLMASLNEEIVYAKGATTQVCILRKNNTSTPIPPEIKQSIAEFEGL